MKTQRIFVYSVFFLNIAFGVTLKAITSEMEYVEVCEASVPGNSACKAVSRLIMGTDHLGKIPKEQMIEVLNEAVRLGINIFDTAPIYVNSIEGQLGEWLRSVENKDLYVITKGGFPYDVGPGTYNSRLKGTSEEIVTHVQEEIDGSSRRLHGDIFIYLMHRDDFDFLNYQRMERPQTPTAQILAALSDPRIRSNYSYLGVSNWSKTRIEEAILAARANPRLVRPQFSSPYFSILEMGAVTIHSGGDQVKHEDMMNPEFLVGVRMMTYSPLGGFSIFSKGWEEAKAAALALKEGGDRYWGNVYEALFHAENEKRFHRMMDFTEAFNKKHQTTYTLDQMANAYILAHPRTDFMIIGPRSVEQLRRTVSSLKLSKMLTPADLDYLYEVKDSNSPQNSFKKSESATARDADVNTARSCARSLQSY